jgi:hypothetical protein
MIGSSVARPRESSCLLLATLLIGCAAITPGGYPEYRALEDTMTEEVDPVVEVLLPSELRKDPEAVDYPRIAAAARRAAHYFACANQAGHPMYLGKPKERAGANAAQGWFTDLAKAADAGQHAELVRLYPQRQQICSACHEY